MDLLVKIYILSTLLLQTSNSGHTKQYHDMNECLISIFRFLMRHVSSKGRQTKIDGSSKLRFMKVFLNYCQYCSPWTETKLSNQLSATFFFSLINQLGCVYFWISSNFFSYIIYKLQGILLVQGRAQFNIKRDFFSYIIYKLQGISLVQGRAQFNMKRDKKIPSTILRIFDACILGLMHIANP